MWRQAPLAAISSMDKGTEAIMWWFSLEDKKGVSF